MHATCVLAWCLAWAGTAAAQTAAPDTTTPTTTTPTTTATTPAIPSVPAGNGAPHYNLGLPMFAAGANDPYNLSSSTTVTASLPAAGSPAPAALPDNYTFDSFRQNIHGYVSAGVATRNGHEFSGGVEVPVVPGKMDLAVGTNTGQIGGFAPLVPGGKPGTITYNSYYAAVHLHPADNVDAYIGVTGGHLGLPAVQVP